MCIAPCDAGVRTFYTKKEKPCSPEGPQGITPSGR